LPGLRYDFAENMMVKFKQKEWFLRRAVSNINLLPKKSLARSVFAGEPKLNLPA